ncbi:MAG: rhodanese-like domain-containing protein [Bacteroidetes bacterium]|nr:rhodanese-like domain-containing protein [Bacteroidota bacterium]
MFQSLKSLFGGGPSADFKALVNQGATIIDVRSKAEYASGHIKGSLNIPLDTLHNNLSKISKSKPVITCCASGMRSASAKGILQNNGFEVYNGGGWSSLKNQL